MKVYILYDIKINAYYHGNHGSWSSDKESAKIYKRKQDVVFALKLMKKKGNDLSAIIVKEGELNLNKVYNAFDLL